MSSLPSPADCRAADVGGARLLELLVLERELQARRRGRGEPSARRGCPTACSCVVATEAHTLLLARVGFRCIALSRGRSGSAPRRRRAGRAWRAWPRARASPRRRWRRRRRLSPPRADQRPCSTQKAASATSPDLGGSTKLMVRTRSCLPPFTMSPDWMKMSSLAGVLDLELVDLARLDDADAALVERLLQRERHGARRAGAVDEVDGEVLVNVRAGDAGAWRRRRQSARRRRQSRGRQGSRRRDAKHLHDNSLSG